MKPVFAVYSSFLQRGYDQLIHDIAIQNLPVTICVDRAGIVGADGETHQGLFDLAFLSHIPNFVIMAPKNFEELEKMLEFSVNSDRPTVIRYPRGGEGKIKFKTCDKIDIGKAEIIKEGKDLTIVALGKMVEKAVEISEQLEKKGTSVEVINARFLKPIDKETILKSIDKTKKIITIEDGLLKGGLGSTVLESVNRSEIKNVKIKSFGYEEHFVEHGKVEELEQKYGLNIESIFKSIEQEILQ